MWRKEVTSKTGGRCSQERAALGWGAGTQRFALCPGSLSGPLERSRSLPGGSRGRSLAIPSCRFDAL